MALCLLAWARLLVPLAARQLAEISAIWPRPTSFVFWQSRHLSEQSSQGTQVTAAAVADPAVVGLLVSRQHLERCVLSAGLLDSSGAWQSGAVGVQEHHHQPLRGRFRLHPEWISLLTWRILLPLDGVDRPRIQRDRQIK
jgi:hypothetical protein